MRFLLPFLLICFSMCAEESIVVNLHNQSTLFPAYIQPIQSPSSALPKSYLNKLIDVLAFDLDHNGFTSISKKQISLHEQGFRTFDKKGWEKEKIAYVIKTKIENNALSVIAYSVGKNQIKGMDGVALTGNLGEDRQKIHRISDAIVSGFFGVPGVASTRILYTVRHKKEGVAAGKWVSEIWEADYDGYNAKRVTHDQNLAITPTYFPPNKNRRSNHFFYVSYQLGQPKLFMGSTHKKESLRLSYVPGNQLMPAVSPTKDCVAFICDAFGNPDLFIQQFSEEKGMHGNGRCIFASSFGAQGSPTFSPDGKKIAFVSNKDGSPRVYVMTIPAKGKGTPTLITKQNRENTSPAWSPDGKKLAYSAMENGVRQIWIYDFTTQKERPLTSGSTHKENPSFGPDSLHIVFNNSSKERSELYLTNLNQKTATKISRGAGEKRFPSWEKR